MFGATGIAPDASERIGPLDAARGELADRDPHAPVPPRLGAAGGRGARAVGTDGGRPARLGTRGRARRWPRDRDSGTQLERAVQPSQIDRVLTHTPLPTLIAAHALGAPHVLEWWTTWRGTRVAVRGADLIAAGIAPGPAIGRALGALRAAMLDGVVTDVD